MFGNDIWHSGVISTNDRTWRIAAIFEIAMVFAVFALEGGWPPPDPNEPHYLCKAFHFWHSDWCPKDFFLDSADTHVTFYVTAGALTRWFSLALTAWIGRVITWALMAAGWWRLSSAITPRFGWSVLAAGLFTALNYRFHMAGEWVVGGFEAKGFAYALVFFALGAAIRGSWNRAWILLGIASAFHVLVGGWSVVAMLGTWALLGADRPALRLMLPGLAIGALLALPGLWPALALTHGEPPEIVTEAYRLYVYERLPHHLWPERFAPPLVERFMLMVCGWIALCAFVPSDVRQKPLRRFVTCTLAIAGGGWLVSLLAPVYPSAIAGVLRLYWFRLSDAMVPLGIAVVGTHWIADLAIRRVRLSKLPVMIATLAVAAHLGQLCVERATFPVPRADGPGKVYDYHDWRDVCAWASSNTPQDALFLTPRQSQTFKWYAGRSEVVTWKDIPQDAADLVRWWQRMNAIHGTGAAPPEARFYSSLADSSVPHLARVARTYKVDYLITSSQPSLPIPIAYQNNAYVVYDMRSLRGD
ncbi:MAG TPA: DUF6798 domain-containing protein [Pirellulales bacterium]|nr:DUF6798 domain-containing protein [Pirellulales bacterium]